MKLITSAHPQMPISQGIVVGWTLTSFGGGNSLRSLLPLARFVLGELYPLCVTFIHQIDKLATLCKGPRLWSTIKVRAKGVSIQQ